MTPASGPRRFRNERFNTEGFAGLYVSACLRVNLRFDSFLVADKVKRFGTADALECTQMIRDKGPSVPIRLQRQFQPAGDLANHVAAECQHANHENRALDVAMPNARALVPPVSPPRPHDGTKAISLLSSVR
jgi:hypothetical protein